MAQPVYTSLQAVQNNHVYIIAGDFRNNAMGGVLGAVLHGICSLPRPFR
jgi:ABC-type Fe3+-hydroxamate transport system substrate-binding protein